jgi:hypothetical protein
MHCLPVPRKAVAAVCRRSVLTLLALAPLLSMAEDDTALAARVDKLLQRMQQLEQRNQALERRVEQLSKAGGAPSASPASAGPWGTRLQDVEGRQQALQTQVDALARAPEDEGGDDGLQVEGGIVAVFQQVNAGGGASGDKQGRVNYRGDVVATLPVGALGDARGTAVGQLRFGQGGGVALRPTHTGTVNSTTFEAAAGSDETYAVVAQAYYQLDWALDGGRFNDLAGSRVELSLGKIDLFGFFDQNAVAGDEGAQFLNNVFVHNPLLDSGGDIGADAYGFAPGARVAYFNEGDTLGWGASLGVFGSGSAATFGPGGSEPLVIAQIEASPKQINGEPRGSYRLYAWTNGRTADLADNEQRHTGVGLSVDQRIGAAWNLFGRWGRRTAGDGNFDDALTLGLEHGGRAWGRGGDSLGLAVGWLKTSDAYSAVADYAASGNERIAELYYRLKLNEHLELTPDFQLIQRAGGDGQAPTVRVFGARASLGF